MDSCLKRAIVQLDILEPGVTYGVVVNDGRYSRDELMQLIGCYKDHYLFINEKGFKESFLKSDLLNGSWKVKGINPRKMLLEAAEKLSGIEKANEEEDLSMKAKKNMEELVEKCMKWLEDNPGEGLHIKSKFHTYNLSNPQASIARDTVLQRMNDQGKKVVIEGGRPKLLVYKEDEKTQTNNVIMNNYVPDKEKDITMDDDGQGFTAKVKASDSLSSLLEGLSLFEAGIVKKNYINQDEDNDVEEVEEEYVVEGSSEWLEKLTPIIKADRDRKFLVEKQEELKLRIVDAQERLDRAQTRLAVEIDLYQEFLDDITKHLKR